MRLYPFPGAALMRNGLPHKPRIVGVAPGNSGRDRVAGGFIDEGPKGGACRPFSIGRPYAR